ncbi:MAG: glycosyltransferase [Bacteroidales bacterium]|nr:glycosyltransferase [Bacteroidales bacterium]
MVSVIIPNYNHAKYLEERIDSVLNQSYKDFEVIVLDDYSTDNSKEVINKYAGHPKVSHIILNEENSGSTFKQWHKGFELAKGEYIWIAESDDMAHPDFLKILMGAIGDDKSVTLAASGITLINEEGKIIGHTGISKSKKPRKYTSSEFIRENMLLGNHLLNASSAIFRKDVLNKIPKDYTKLKSSGDYLFWLEIANMGNVIEMPAELDYFRRSTASVTPRLYASGHAFEEAKIIYKRLIELGYIKGIYKKLVVAFRLNQIRTTDKFTDEDVRKRCLQLWKVETNTPKLDYALLLMCGAYRKLRRKIRNIL